MLGTAAATERHAVVAVALWGAWLTGHARGTLSRVPIAKYRTATYGGSSSIMDNTEVTGAADIPWSGPDSSEVVC